MVALPGLVAAIAAPLLTLTTNGIDRRKLLLGFVLLVLAANLLVGFAPSFPVLLPGRALLGVSVGGFWSFAVAVGRAFGLTASRKPRDDAHRGRRLGRNCCECAS